MCSQAISSQGEIMTGKRKHSGGQANLQPQNGNAQADRPNRIPWPPLIYIAAIAAGFALGRVWPLPWPGGLAGDLLFGLGLFLAGIAILLDVTAFKTFQRHRTTIMPHKGASHLITDGPFAFSRNPIYLGNTLLMVGIGLMAGEAWLLPLAILAAFAVTYLAIQREEKHLELKFGRPWRDYAKRVRRWV